MLRRAKKSRFAQSAEKNVVRNDPFGLIFASLASQRKTRGRLSFCLLDQARLHSLFAGKEVKMGPFNPIPESLSPWVAGVPAPQPLFESAVLGQASHRMSNALDLELD